MFDNLLVIRYNKKIKPFASKSLFNWILFFFQSDQFVVIKDIRPVATHHFLVLSHKHIQSAKCLKPCEQDRNLREFIKNYF